MNIIIVGAGISGCVCANRLAMSGHTVTLIEKGRGVGGRMSTRRMNGARIDHGAQFFTARDPRMKELVKDWEEQGIVVPWYDHVPGREDIPQSIRYRGVNGMTNPAKRLAESFALRENFLWTRFFLMKSGRLMKERVKIEDCLRIIWFLPCPCPQMLELFQRSQFELESKVMDQLEAVQYTRCLALLGILDKPSVLS